MGMPQGTQAIGINCFPAVSFLHPDYHCRLTLLAFASASIARLRRFAFAASLSRKFLERIIIKGVAEGGAGR